MPPANTPPSHIHAGPQMREPWVATGVGWDVEDIWKIIDSSPMMQAMMASPILREPRFVFRMKGELTTLTPDRLYGMIFQSRGNVVNSIECSRCSDPFQAVFSQCVGQTGHANGACAADMWAGTGEDCAWSTSRRPLPQSEHIVHLPCLHPPLDYARTPSFPATDFRLGRTEVQPGSVLGGTPLPYVSPYSSSGPPGDMRTSQALTDPTGTPNSASRQEGESSSSATTAAPTSSAESSRRRRRGPSVSNRPIAPKRRRGL